jgi:hypothetical protein
LLVGN